MNDEISNFSYVHKFNLYLSHTTSKIARENYLNLKVSRKRFLLRKNLFIKSKIANLFNQHTSTIASLNAHSFRDIFITHRRHTNYPRHTH